MQTLDIDDQEVAVHAETEAAAEPPEQNTSYKFEQTDTKLMDMTSFDDDAALVRPSDARLLPTEEESDDGAEAKSNVEINIYESDDEEQEISANRLLNQATPPNAKVIEMKALKIESSPQESSPEADGKITTREMGYGELEEKYKHYMRTT